MSQQAAKAFLEKMKTDQAFADQVMAIDEMAERLRFINAEGFDCTMEELSREMELTEQELEAVAGGKARPVVRGASLCGCVWHGCSSS